MEFFPVLLAVTLQPLLLHNLHKKLVSVTQKGGLLARAFTSESGAGGPRSSGAAVVPRTQWGPRLSSPRV